MPLQIFGARFYDPALGRFIQPDSLVPQPGNPLAWDRYAYANNSPVVNNDPDGHCSVPTSPIITPWGIIGFYGSCVQDAVDTYHAYKEGERNPVALYSEVTGLKDALVSTANDVHQLNRDVSTVFSNAPLEERIMPSARVGIFAVGTAGTLVGLVQAGVSASKSAPTYCRYCSNAEVDAIKDTDLLRGGRPGRTYFTTNNYISAQDAQEKLALYNLPEAKVKFSITNSPKIIGPSVVAPVNGQPGGGIEYWSYDKIQVIIHSIQTLMK